MKRQIDSSLFERLLLSSGKANKDKVLELAQKGQKISKPEDLLKNPYVFDINLKAFINFNYFLGLYISPLSLKYPN